MTSLLLMGGGGHCRACIDVIEAAARHSIAGIVQPPAEGSNPVLGYRVLGSDDDLPALLQQIPEALVTVGQIRRSETRIRLFKLLKSFGAGSPVIQSPTAYCSRHAVIGEGSILMHGSVLNANAGIGANCIINSQALIEHDVEIAAGIEVPIAAVALGATVIEKHLTLDRNLPGPDHKASLEPDEFAAMVRAIRNIEQALGDGIKRPSLSEAKNKPIARKSLVAARPIRAGEPFTPENVTAKRPGTGISPMRWDEVMGRTARRDYTLDKLIEL